MCAARTQTIGTIYSRLSGLLKEGIIKFEDRPLWYDVYKAFPPEREPVYRSVQGGDPVPPIKPPRILYYEDQIRAYV
jgi:small subunit ribosomal protein S23